MTTDRLKAAVDRFDSTGRLALWEEDGGEAVIVGWLKELLRIREAAAQVVDLEGLNGLGKRVHEWISTAGFGGPETLEPVTVDGLLAKLAMVCSEVGEAVEAVRMLDAANLVEELADVVIRTADIAAALGLDLDGAVRAKQAANELRSGGDATRGKAA